MKIAVIIITALFVTGAPIAGILFEIQSNEVETEENKDTIPPTSSIESPTVFIKPPTYAEVGTAGFKITWKGSDNAGGSGIDHFDVQYRSSPTQCYCENTFCRGTVPGFSHWRDLVTNTTAASKFVMVSYERTMEFRVRAVDKSGNEESWSPIAESVTIIVTVPVNIYKALVMGHRIAEEVEGRIRERVPDDTPPSSEVEWM